MRLTQEQVDACIQATKASFGESAEIWLFGSRVDDSKRGGDIDLYVETDIDAGMVDAKLKFRALIWPVLGEQKIDLVVHSRKRPIDPIHAFAKKTGILLTS